MRARLKKATPYLLAAPAAILVFIFAFGVVNGVLQGFGIMPFLGRTELTPEYYIQALTRSDLSASILFSLYYATVASVLATVAGVILSWALVRIKAGRVLKLASLQIPIMTMHALVALAVIFVFSGSGLAARLFSVFGMVADANTFPSVVGDPSGWGIIAVYLWKEIPFVAFSTVFIMGGITDTYAEAAATLGASGSRTFFEVTLPLCKGAIAKAFLVIFAFAFGAYEVPFLLGPTLPQALPVLAYVEFQDPDILNRCYAMALNGVMTFICSLIAMAYFAIVVRERRNR